MSIDPMKFFLAFAITVSIFAMIVPITFLFWSVKRYTAPAVRKPIIGFIFTSTCALGSILALYPKSDARPFYQSNKIGQINVKKKRLTEGHHPSCTHFSSHRLQFKDKTLCAACTGLSIGALLSIAFSIQYFWLESWFTLSPSATIIFGEFSLVLGFLQFFSSRYTRVSMNALFVIGSSLLLQGTDALTQDLATDLLIFCSIVFWLWTRISISKWKNKKICESCRTCELQS